MRRGLGTDSSSLHPPPPPCNSQLLRKRHIGNDIVTIVFQEPGSKPFCPTTIRSHFQHVFLVVRAHAPCTPHTSYRWVPGRSQGCHCQGPSRLPLTPASLPSAWL